MDGAFPGPFCRKQYFYAPGIPTTVSMHLILNIVLTLAFLYGVLMLWYAYGWQCLPPFEASPAPGAAQPRVSVIIPARDEERHIGDCLQAVLAQHYPSTLLEILVVDDHSTDGTAEAVRAFAERGVRLISLAEHLPPGTRPLNAYKKKAIETAIGLCTGQLIVTTDADCVMGPHWIETLVRYYQATRARFMAAPVAYCGDEGFFKAFQSLDFLTMQGITAASAQLRCGSMCNGANLAYERQAFRDVGGFQGIDCIASGDDMLLMYKMYRAFPRGIGFVKHADAIVRTLPAPDLQAFIQQRIRWASKAGKYDDKRLTLVLAFVYVWNLALLLLLPACFFYPWLWPWWLGLILYKTVAELFFLWPVARFFGKTGLLWYFFPAQLLHIPYIVVAGWLGKFGSYRWKSRRVR